MGAVDLSPIPFEYVPYLLGSGGALLVVGALLNLMSRRGVRLAPLRRRRQAADAAVASTPAPVPQPQVTQSPAHSPMSASPIRPRPTVEPQPAERAGLAAIGHAAQQPQATSRQTSDETPIQDRGPSLAAEGPRPPEMVRAARHTDDTDIATLAAELILQRELAAARVRLHEDLATLDRNHWHIERDFIVNGISIAAVVFGPTGVFAIAAGSAWNFSDLPFLHRLGKDFAPMLPGYPDPVRTAIYLPFDTAAPRSWFDGQGAGGWIVGGGHLRTFLGQFHDDGFSPSDITALRQKIAGGREPDRTIPLPEQPPRG